MDLQLDPCQLFPKSILISIVNVLAELCSQLHSLRSGTAAALYSVRDILKALAISGSFKRAIRDVQAEFIFRLSFACPSLIVRSSLVDRFHPHRWTAIRFSE